MIEIIHAAVFPHEYGIEHFTQEHMIVTAQAIVPIILALTTLWYASKALAHLLIPEDVK